MSRFTVGLEEEYQLIDPTTADLCSSAHAVLACDWTGEMRTELQESTVEIGTRVCDDSVGVRDELRRLRMQAAAAASALELEIVAAGLHPFSDWRGHRLTEGDRYAEMALTYGRIARDEHNFGMHVHIALEGDRTAALNTVRHYIPHLLALSCSSPFHEGEDTGYSSYRMVLWRRWPGAGLPPRLDSENHYRRYVADLLRAGVIGDERNLYWSIRPHSTYPTLEFRMCDVCPRIEDAAAIAALTRTLVAAATEGLTAPDPPTGWSHELQDAALADDCWRASRAGLDARFVAPGLAAGFESARDAVRRLIDTVIPAAAMIGEDTALDGIETILMRGNGADRLRAFHARCDDLAVCTRWLAAETVTGAGMDRRANARDRTECR